MPEVILDVDTGVDDALAVLYALRSRDLRVRGLTCVAGNVGLADVVRNTTALVGALGVDVPVAAGADRPLVDEPPDVVSVHGSDGLLGVVPPGDPVPLDRRHAVALLHETITTAPGRITLVGLGPLTNLALLARTHPEVVAQVAEVRIMGGSLGAGNITATAEFNHWVDPHAAATVLGAGWPVRLYGLDVFYDPVPHEIEIAALRQHDDVAAHLAGELLDRRRQDGFSGRAYLGDAGLVTSLDAGGATDTEMPVTVDTRPGPTRGMTLADRRTSRHEFDARQVWPRVRVATAIDAAAVTARYLEVLTRP